MGNKFLSISAGTVQAPAAAPDSTLASKEATELSALLDQAKGTITDIDDTVRNANGFIGQCQPTADDSGRQSQFGVERG